MKARYTFSAILLADGSYFSESAGKVAMVASLVCRRAVSALLLCVAAVPVSHCGEQFRVNSFTFATQGTPAVSSQTDGRFVIVWSSAGHHDGDNLGVFGQRFDAGGAPEGGEFQINSFTTVHQYGPDVIHDSSGGFLVVWVSLGQDGIFGQRFASSGLPVGNEFQINTNTVYGQAHPRVSRAPSGEFVVVWKSDHLAESNYEIFARRLDSAATPLGEDFQINDTTLEDQERPRISHDSAGGFAVVWSSQYQDGYGWGVFGKRFDSSGGGIGAEFQVNVTTAYDQRYPAVAHDGGGDFAVVWHSYGQDGSEDGIFGRRFSNAAGPLGGEFQINAYTDSKQRFPAVSRSPAGNFVVVWESLGQDGYGGGIFARRLSSSGNLLFSEFQVNTFTPSKSYGPVLSQDSSGSFVIAWRGDDEEPSFDIFARLLDVGRIATGTGTGGGSKARTFRGN